MKKNNYHKFENNALEEKLYQDQLPITSISSKDCIKFENTEENKIFHRHVNSYDLHTQGSLVKHNNGENERIAKLEKRKFNMISNKNSGKKSVKKTIKQKAKKGLKIAASLGAISLPIIGSAFCFVVGAYQTKKSDKKSKKEIEKKSSV